MMSAIWPALACFAVYIFAYRVYSVRIANRLFRLDDERATPAHRLRNDHDYLPTNRYVLFGHHFASITGLSPMLGPAIAVIWGWLPAMVWVVFGAVFIGCVHDFAALVLSIRNEGRSIGKVAEGVIGPRAKGLFLAIIFFGVALAMGVFTFVIASLFSGAYGTAVIPSGGLMIVAAVIGWLVHRRGASLGPLAIVGFLALLGLVALGAEFPLTWANHSGWMILLLAYALAASVLPVWSLLQPRDFLNSLLLYLGLALCFIGFFVKAPDFAAPAFDPEPPGAPPFYPFVFIVIACGAASGFHALVSSGTTAKQLARESDARFIGYGGMIGESLLGLLAVLATTVALGGQTADAAGAAWKNHYASWHAAQGLGAKMGRFIEGAASFVAELGIPSSLAVSLVAVIVVSFALTTLDSATRLLRYNVEEIANSFGQRWLANNRYLASAVAVGAIAGFAFYEIDGRPAGLILWKIFGSVNQLLAGLTLLTATLWLRQRGRRIWCTALPMTFMLVTTAIAIASNLSDFSNDWSFEDRPGDPIAWPLFVVAVAIAILGIWMIIEAILSSVSDPKC